MVTGNKIKPAFEIADENLNPKNTLQYKLSIQFALNGFCFSISDITTGKLILLKEFLLKEVKTKQGFNDTFAEIFKNEVFLNSEVKQTFISMEGGKSILIPNPLFEETKQDFYWNYNYSSDDFFKQGFNTLKSINAKLLYRWNLDWFNILNQYFPKAEFVDKSYAFLNALLNSNKNNQDQKCFLNIGYQEVDIVVISGPDLIFHNVFPFKTDEDILFFVLSVYDQLKLNPESQTATILGNVAKTSNLYALLFKYIRNVNFGNKPNNLLFSYQFGSIPSHYYYSLFCIS